MPLFTNTMDKMNSKQKTKYTKHTKHTKLPPCRGCLFTQSVCYKMMSQLFYVVFFLICFYNILHVACPYFTTQNLFYPPNVERNSKCNPIPPASVCQCLDKLGISFVIQRTSPFRLKGLKFRSGFQRKKLQLLLLLLCGDVEINPGPSQLILGHLNTRSIASVTNEIDKPTLIQDLISDSNIEIFSVNETWLHPNELPQTLNSFVPENYSFLNCPRVTGRGGGVGFIYRNFLNLQRCDLPIYSSFESLFAKCSLGNKNFSFLTIYRPPASSASTFFTEFSDLLENISSTLSELIICGDFNFHVDDNSNRESLKFLSILDNFNLMQHINFPTHKLGHTLDLFITRQNSVMTVKNEFEYVCFSDHLVIISEICIPAKCKINSTFKEVRKLSKIDLELFKNDILSSRLFSESMPVDTDSYAEQFELTLSELLNKHAPSVKIKICSKKSKPFITKEIKEAKSKRSRLEPIWRRTRSESHKSAFHNQAKIVSKLITKSKQEYYRKTISSLHGKPKKLWSTLNSLLNRTPTSKLPTFTNLGNLTEAFSEFFRDKIQLLCNKLPPTTGSAYSVPPIAPPELSEFTETTPAEIAKIIMNCNDSTCLLDAIPTKLLKSCLDVLAKPITDLVNISLSAGSFPKRFKIASVRPLIKKHNLSVNDFNSFRPISNLSFVSKILERVVLNRIFNHIQSFSIFSPFQSAYRKFHSTETALLKIQNDLLLAIDQKKVSALVLLDLSAAFDTIDHNILLHRLNSWFGISDKALSFMQSYLSDRSQFVIIDGCTSTTQPLLTGVPQGSVLGPLLFTMYTTPLSYVMNDNSVSHHLYADDTQMYCSFSAQNSQSSTEHLSVTLDKVHQWFSENRLSLNSSKTEFLLIGNKQQLAKLPSISLSFNNNVINSTSSARNLGFIFQNDDLSHQLQINKVCQTCNFQIRQLRQIRSSIDYKSSILLANALVSSQLDYCNSLYYDLPASSLHKLQVIQNTIARVVVPKTKRFDHIKPILKQLHWLPINARINFKIATLTYKVLNHKQPSYLSDLLVYHTVPYHLKSCGKNILKQPFISSKAGRRSFSYCASFVWNQLPDHIRTATSLICFRKLLKTHFFPP